MRHRWQAATRNRHGEPDKRDREAMSSELTPAERTLRARAAAYRLHSLYDSRELTANARAAFADRFTRQVDPDGILSESERQRRAECARKAYFADLAARSAKARRQRRARK